MARELGDGERPAEGMPFRAPGPSGPSPVSLYFSETNVNFLKDFSSFCFYPI